jgi:NAD(P)-dependent dehydrogenase (short-subunit alcohol dehydrogenase family)
MDLHLSGKRAVVTGASRGIGLATVRALRAEGARVVAAARSGTDVLHQTGAVIVPVDLAEPGGAAHLIDRAVDELGDIDVLVNNVGGADRLQTLVFADTGDEEWHEIFGLNLMAPVRVTRAALPSLVRTQGVVVTVSSDGALTPRQTTLGTPIAYPAAKAALNAVMKALSVELAAQGVRVTTITPGATLTSLWEGEIGHHLAAAAGVSHDDLIAALPTQAGLLTGRWILPDEIAAAIAFVCSPLSASTIGANFVVDGGARRSL